MIILKRFFPLMAMILFSAINPILSQNPIDQRVQSAIKKADQIPDEEPTKDTVIDGWSIRYLAEPQGTIGWQWDFTKWEPDGSFTNYIYDVNGRCLGGGFASKDKQGIFTHYELSCAPPPIAFEKTGLMPEKKESSDSDTLTTVDQLALNIFAQAVFFTDSINQQGDFSRTQHIMRYDFTKDGDYYNVSIYETFISVDWGPTENPDVWGGYFSYADSSGFYTWYFKIENEQFSITSKTGDGSKKLLELAYILKDLQKIADPEGEK